MELMRQSYQVLAEEREQTLRTRTEQLEHENAELQAKIALLVEVEAKRNAHTWRDTQYPEEEGDNATMGAHLRIAGQNCVMAFGAAAAGACARCHGTARRLSQSVSRRKIPVATGVNSLPNLINEEDWVKYTANSGMLFPVGPLKFRWDLWVLVLILYSAVTVPFRLGMDHPATGKWWTFEVVVSLCFLTDLILNFRTAYLDGDQFVIDKALVVRSYLRGWFLLDLSSSIPLELIDLIFEATSGEGGGGGAGQLRMLRALRLVRLLRLLRLLKIQQYIDLIEDALNVNMAFLSLLKLVLSLCYLTHIIGCAWYWLAASTAASSPDGEAITWLTSYDDGAGVDASTWVHYLYAVYWALTTLTTIGYGDIIPTNDSERGFALATFLVGTLVFGYMISSVGDMVQNADPNAVKIDEKLDEVKVYLRWHKFKPALAVRIRKYYEFYFSRKSAMDEEAIIANLAPGLRQAAQAHLVHRTVTRIALFAPERPYASLEMQLAVYEMLHPLLREAKESITDELSKGAGGARTIFFIRRGTVAAMGDLNELELFEIDSTVECGAIIGEHSLTSAAQCHVTYIAKTRCEMYAMGVDELRRVVSTLSSDHKDQLAQLVHRVYASRSTARASTLRAAALSIDALNMKGAAALQLQAALRLQAWWVRMSAERIFAAGKDRSTMSAVLPGLYHAAFRGDSTAAPLNPDRSISEKLDDLAAQIAKVEAHLAALPPPSELRRLAAIPSLGEIERAAKKAVAEAVAQALPGALAQTPSGSGTGLQSKRTTTGRS